MNTAVTTPMTARGVADWFVAYADEAIGEDSDLSNMKVHKLLYFAQGHWLATHDSPLFAGTFKAWSHGPVIPTLYHAFKEHGRNPLPVPGDEFDWSTVPSDVDDFLVEVWKHYGAYSAAALRNLSHDTTPWQVAWDVQGPEPAAIDAAAMRDWFAGHPLS